MASKVQVQSSDARALFDGTCTGIGVDMFEIARMKHTLAAHPRLAQRVFTAEEILYATGKARPEEHFAAFFAAREAVLKAIGTGFSDGIGFKDVSVSHDAYGKPIVVLCGRAKVHVDEKHIIAIELSLSHTHTTAVANALALVHTDVPQKFSQEDVQEQLRVSFRDARSIVAQLNTSMHTYLDSSTDIDSSTDTAIGL